MSLCINRSAFHKLSTRRIAFKTSKFAEKTRKKPKSKMSEAPKRTWKRKRKETYNIYIYKVLKQVHPEIGVSKKGMAILNSFICDTFQQIAEEGGKLVKFGKKQTMTAREISTACKLILPGELAKHAVSEGSKAMQKYQGTK